MIIYGDTNNFLKNFFSTTKSQAFLLAGEISYLEDLLIRYILCEKKSFCKKCSTCLAEGSIDFKKFENDFLKIEDAREIQRAANQKSLSGAKIFLIKSHNIAEDAQSTLLKTIEEPHPETYFVMSGVREHTLTAPLLSRLSILSKMNKEDNLDPKFRFTADSIPQNREEAEELFRNIELWINGKIKKGNNFKLMAEFLGEIFEAKKRFYEKTYSLKMIFEHLYASKCYFEK